MRGKPGIGAIIAAILLPPLGIFLVRGLGPEFWIGAVLTLIGWVPGVLFALFVLLRPRAETATYA
jgi:uncharacterized membrane protein YqaE (UPF0057 family)